MPVVGARERLLRLAARDPRRRAGEEAELAGRMAAIFEAGRRAYGSPRIHAELREDGVQIGRGRVARLMRRVRPAAARRRRAPRTTDSRHDLPVAPNLLDRALRRRPAGRGLAGRHLYLPTDEGWLYLAAIEDLATREVVGWSMADHLAASSPRRPGDGHAAPAPSRGLIHHSDRGVQGDSSGRRNTSRRGLRWARGGGVRIGRGGRVALAGPARGGAARGPAAVLGGDRGGAVERGRGG